jgi:diaminopimelate epimerase
MPMQDIAFAKMSGAGNDFIIIDHHRGDLDLPDLATLARRVCRRKHSVGADGLIVIEPAQSRADFRWRFFNADGSRAEMCGNGARCAARFAYLNCIAGRKLCFETDAGTIFAQVMGARVSIRMTEPRDLAMDQVLALSGEALAYSFINTGVPHVVLDVHDVAPVDVAGLGRQIRFHPRFAPRGTNVNFVALGQHGILAIHTYERGVEDETLACGTGNVAAAIVMAGKHHLPRPLQLVTRSGSRLTVDFAGDPRGTTIDDVRLAGDARLIYEGRLHPQAWDDDSAISAPTEGDDLP